MTSKTERMIHGIASSERLIDGSRYQDGSGLAVMLARGCALATPIPLLFEHGGDPIGKIVHLHWLGDKLYCRATIFDNAGGRQAWEKIEGYKLRGLSCGFVRDRYEIKLKVEGVVKCFSRYKITEISVVRSPLNQDCFFAIFSGGAEARVAGQRSLSEHRRSIERARKLIASLEKQFPSSSRRSAPQKFSPADIQHLWAQRKKGI
jgi:Caudovirus prohead serine protease